MCNFLDVVVGRNVIINIKKKASRNYCEKLFVMGANLRIASTFTDNTTYKYSCTFLQTKRIAIISTTSLESKCKSEFESYGQKRFKKFINIK